jgi:transcriptional regulator with XRE-family HTH domain
MADLGHVIAANVRAERARRQWRQADLAERLGWDVGTVGHLETGRRDVRATDLPALCRAFGISLARLLQDADEDDLRDLRL